MVVPRLVVGLGDDWADTTARPPGRCVARRAHRAPAPTAGRSTGGRRSSARSPSPCWPGPADAALLRCGRRRRSRSPSWSDGASRPDDAARRRLVGGRRWTRRCPGAATASRSTAARCDPIPARRRSPTASTACRAVVDHDAFAWTDGALARAWPLPGSVLYELHVGHVLAGGHVRRRDRAPRPPRRPRRRRRRAAAGRRVLRRPRLGLRRRRPLRAPPRLRRPGRAEAPRRRLPRAGLGVIFDVVYNHLGPAGNYLGRVRPVLHRPPPDRLGRRRELRRAGQRRGPPLRRRQRAHVAARLPRRRAAPRRRARHRRHVGPPHPRAARASRSTRWPPTCGKPLFLIAESDRNDPRARAAPRRRRATGWRAAWADEWHHALHAVLTGEHDGYYADFGHWADLAKALRQAWVHDGTYSPHRGPGPRPAG